MNTAPQLFLCEKLKARISLASCEANRAKPDIQSFLDNKAARHGACKDCTDWKEWLPIPHTVLLENRIQDLEKELAHRESMAANDLTALQERHQQELVERVQMHTKAMEQLKETYAQMVATTKQEADGVFALWHEVFENTPAVPAILCELEHAQNKHPIFANDLNHALALLTEEVGEVAKDINNGDMVGAKKEIMQVAVVCIRFLEETELAE